MAGNNSLQFLRGSSSRRKASSQTLLAGQPFFETDTNKLYVGNGGNTPLSSAQPLFQTQFDEISSNITGINTKLSENVPLQQLQNLKSLTINATHEFATTGNSHIVGNPVTFNGQKDETVTFHPFECTQQNLTADLTGTGGNLVVSITTPPWGATSSSFFLLEVEAEETAVSLSGIGTPISLTSVWGKFHAYRNDATVGTIRYFRAANALCHFIVDGNDLSLGIHKAAYGTVTNSKLQIVSLYLFY